MYYDIIKIDISKVHSKFFLAIYLYANYYQLTETYSVEKVKEMLGDIVTTERRHNKYLKVTSSSNADLPPYLYQGSMFRSISDICGQVSCRSVLVCVMLSCLVLYSWISVDLSKKIHVAQLNPNMLVGKYIPSLVAKKFDVSQGNTCSLSMTRHHLRVSTTCSKNRTKTARHTLSNACIHNPHQASCLPVCVSRLLD